jgi:hypothetical protein
MVKFQQCSFKDCDQPASAKGLCASHHAKAFQEAVRSKTCANKLCSRSVKNKTTGLCSSHYELYLAKNGIGKRENRPPFNTAEEAWNWELDNRVTEDKKTGCQIWGGTIRDGYGLFVWKNREINKYAHTYAYEKAHGSIGYMVPDHTKCRNRLCINPDHIELVTNEENSSRANFLYGRHGTGRVMHTDADIETFWGKVDKPDEPDQKCWLWMGTQDRGDPLSYGRFWYQNHRIRSHRFAWLVTHGSLTDGFAVHHKCDIRCCVNPDHLQEVPLRDNAGASQAKYRTYSNVEVFPKQRRQDLEKDVKQRMRKITKRKEAVKQRKNSTLTMPSERDEQRFFQKIDKTSSPKGCWLWSGTIEKSGTGRFWLNGYSQTAHIVSWVIHRGLLPPPNTRLHQTCENNLCVNPYHIAKYGPKESSRKARQKSLDKQKGRDQRT